VILWHRGTTLEDVVDVLGPDRCLVIARELTKIHEEFLRGRGGQVRETMKSRDSVKGEITLLIAKADPPEVETPAPGCPTIRERVQQIMSEENIDEKSALKRVAKERGVSKSEAYRKMQREKTKDKREK
jgi:16S rRNA (cytidine1402-2'-O)-methyltransferase